MKYCELCFNITKRLGFVKASKYQEGKEILCYKVCEPCMQKLLNYCKAKELRK